MPINMTDYRMIINERVYNVLQIMIDFAGPLEEGEPQCLIQTICPCFAETSAQIQNAQSTFQKPMSAAVHVQCGY